jgi:sugar phosphate isomerase/epimerase
MTSCGRRWGIDTWMLEALPIEKAVRALDEAGIACLEYPYEHFSPFEKNDTMHARIRTLLEETSTCRIEPSQMHAPFGELDIQLASEDEPVRTQGLERARRWLEYANMLGVKVMVFHTAVNKGGDELSSTEQMPHVRDANMRAFKEIGQMARDVGVRVAVENRLERVFGSKPRDLLEIVGSDPDTLGVCFDTGHANVNGLACYEFAREVDDSLIATHIHDNDGRSDQHLLPLMGNIDWGSLARSLDIISYTGPMILEVPGSDHDERLCLNKLRLTKELLSSGLIA